MSSVSDFVIENGVLKKYVGHGGDVVVPEGVTEIGGGELFSGAFYGCEGLTSIMLPKSLKSLRAGAFHNCKNLTGITIPPGITCIEDDVFMFCENLAKVELPEGVTSIGSYSFQDCAFSEITLPISVTRIGECAFAGCKKLIGITIPENVKSIGNSAFSGCKSLTDVTIPESVAEIGDDAFSWCEALTGITIPENTKSIGNRAFEGCGGLTVVVIPEGVKRIGEGAFTYCKNLRRLTIPDSADEIGKDLFNAGAETLISISNISALPTALRRNAALCFAEDGGDPADPRYAGYCKYIKANAEKLVDWAMQYPALLSLMCRERLIPPKSLDVYLAAAQKRENAETISILLDYRNDKTVVKRKENAEKRDKKAEETVVERFVARQSKEGIEGLNIAVTGKLDTFGSRNELKDYVIGKGAKLASTLSAKVDYLIMNDPNSDSAKAQKAKELGIEVVTERDFNGFVGRLFQIDGTSLVWYLGDGSEVAIPSGVTSIGNSAFAGRKSLESVTIPDGVTSIEAGAFYECKSLGGLTLPNGIASIGGSAFGHCSSIESLTIPQSVTSIGDYAFACCDKLASIKIPGGVTSIGRDVFEYSPKVTIHAPVGSYAEQYAKEHSIPFVAD